MYQRDESWGKALLVGVISAFTAAPMAGCLVGALVNGAGGTKDATGWLMVATWTVVTVASFAGAKVLFHRGYQKQMRADGIQRYQAGPYRSWE